MDEIVYTEKDFIKNNKDYVYDNSGGWHERKHYPLSKNSYYGITCCGTVTGCGLGQMRGFANLNESNFDEFKSALEKIEKDYKVNGVGCFIATLGQYWYDREKLLLKLGFVLVKEYANYRHGQDGNYKQKMYTYSF